MIGPNMQVKLNGTIFTAFQIYCAKRGCETGSEGMRQMVRDLPEYKELMQGSKSDEPAKTPEQDNNPQKNEHQQPASSAG